MNSAQCQLVLTDPLFAQTSLGLMFCLDKDSITTLVWTECPFSADSIERLSYFITNEATKNTSSPLSTITHILDLLDVIDNDILRTGATNGSPLFMHADFQPWYLSNTDWHWRLEVKDTPTHFDISVVAWWRGRQLESQRRPLWRSTFDAKPLSFPLSYTTQTGLARCTKVLMWSSVPTFLRAWIRNVKHRGADCLTVNILFLIKIVKIPKSVRLYEGVARLSD